jgi:SAM-dependent methyltransferase
MMVNTDSSWEKIGAVDPYFGVVSQERFRKSNLHSDAKMEFFASGSADVAKVFENIEKYVDPRFEAKRVLDFGCGVARLVIPFAQKAEQVVGVDVSPSMLAEARSNCDAAGLKNVVLMKSDDDLRLIQGQFDLIHSYIVFQHIDPRRGERIIKNLLSHLAEGGICVLQLTFMKAGAAVRVAQWSKRWIPFAYGVASTIRKRELSELFAPRMLMNDYDMNRIMALLHPLASSLYAEFTNHGGCLGLQIYFQKKRAGAN